MVRRFVFVCAFAMLAALPVAASAAPGEANGGRTCVTFEETEFVEGCFAGGGGQGGGGGRLDIEFDVEESDDDEFGITESGGGGQGGGGGRFCVTFQGQQRCEAGRGD